MSTQSECGKNVECEFEDGKFICVCADRLMADFLTLKMGAAPARTLEEEFPEN